MITIDTLLLKFLKNNLEYIEASVSSKDMKVLNNLSKTILMPQFITENQSHLLVKILQENTEKLPDLSLEINEALSAPSWSKPFRKIDQIKNLYIFHKADPEPVIVIEMTFSSQIRKIITELSKKTEDVNCIKDGRIYWLALTEKNIVMLIDRLRPLGFHIDEELKNHYNTIKSWKEPDFKNQFLLTNIVNTNFQKHITDDLGLTTAIDKNIIEDRSVRYQYRHEPRENSPTTLTEIIASRSKPKVWVDSNLHALEDVFKSLLDLKRLPAMVVFEINNDLTNIKNLETLTKIFEKFNIENNVGIYFRLSNSADGKKFNAIIAEKSYNKMLDNTTQIVGVEMGKIPKFFLKTLWKPMSVIYLGSNLRAGKTSVYINCCDLIISYSDKDSIFDTGALWR
jgi:hypothetical protein